MIWSQKVWCKENTYKFVEMKINPIMKIIFESFMGKNGIKTWEMRALCLNVELCVKNVSFKSWILKISTLTVSLPCSLEIYKIKAFKMLSSCQFRIESEFAVKLCLVQILQSLPFINYCGNIHVDACKTTLVWDWARDDICIENNS